MDELRRAAPITFIWGAGVIVVEVLYTLSILPVYYIVYEPSLTFKKFQLWRLLTGILFYGKVNINTIISFAFNFRFIYSTETGIYNNRKSNFLFIIILCSILIYILSGMLHSFFLADSLTTAVLFICSKLIQGNAVIYGLIPVPIAWLPFINIIITVASGGGFLQIVIGIIAGHTVFFLLYVFPVITKTPILKAPRILQRYLDQ